MAIVLALVLVAAMITAVSYLLSPELGHGTNGACIGQLVGYLPLYSIKVVIVVWQIVTQVRSVAEVYTLPKKQDIMCWQALVPCLCWYNRGA